MKHLEKLLNTIPIKTFKYLIGREVAIGFIEGVLSKANVKDVYQMIEENKYNLFDGNEKAKLMIIKSRRILLEHEKIIREIATPNNVLQVLRETRPDIYGLIINHKKGLKWLNKTIRESVDYLFRLANSTV